MLGASSTGEHLNPGLLRPHLLILLCKGIFLFYNQFLFYKSLLINWFSVCVLCVFQYCFTVYRINCLAVDLILFSKAFKHLHLEMYLLSYEIELLGVGLV